MKSYAAKLYIPYITIKPSYSFTGVYPAEICTRSKSQYDNEINLENNATKGAISDKAKKRIKLAIDWLILQSDKQYIFSRDANKFIPVKMKFITLTLPSPQIHTDEEIKEKCLNQFLIEIKRYHKILNYVWRAEAQRNGNIHFHITTDKFIHHRDVSEKWNRIIEKLGYVSRYRDAQVKFHSGGFKAKTELLKQCDEAHQRTAYLKGMAENWNSPPTTQIKSVKSIEQLSNYLSEEFVKNKTKDFFYKEIRPAGSQLEHSHLPQFEKEFQHDRCMVDIYPIEKGKHKGMERWEYYIERRQITGRLWFAGGPCAGAKGVLCEMNDTQQKFVSDFIRTNPDKALPKETVPDSMGRSFSLGTILCTPLQTFQAASNSPFTSDINSYISQLKVPRLKIKKIPEPLPVEPAAPAPCRPFQFDLFNKR